ncbi:hypothetical protein ACFQX7_36685 [Luedemannella flava]
MARPPALARITIGEAVAEYREALERRVARNELAALTFKTYIRDLDEFVALFGADTVLDDVEQDDLDRALTRIAAAPTAGTPGVSRSATTAAGPRAGAHSRARWFVSVRGLFRWRSSAATCRPTRWRRCAPRGPPTGHAGPAWASPPTEPRSCGRRPRPRGRCAARHSSS